MSVLLLSRVLNDHRDHGDTHMLAHVAAFNSKGQMLIERRRDDGKWTLPGGPAKVGETPEQAAKRELYEETGLTAGKLEPLGAITTGGMNLHVFRTTVTGEPEHGHDPDHENDKYQWLSKGDDVKKIAWHKAMDVALGLLGFQGGSK